MSENPAVGGGLPETAEAWEAVRKGIGLLGSALASREPWTEATEQAYQEAVAALSLLQARHADAEAIVRRVATGRCDFVWSGLHDPDDLCDRQRALDDFCLPCRAQAFLGGESGA